MTTTTLHGSVSTRLKDTLKDTLGPQTFALWLGQAARLEYNDTDQTLNITLPHRFALEGVRKHCALALREAVNEHVGPHADIDYHVDSSGFHSPVTAPTPAPRPPARTPVDNQRFRRRLDQFIVGASNQLAYAAACRIADDDLEPVELGHPLFIHGGCGLGKTHLLQGICQRFTQRCPDARVCYTTGEQFTNDYIQAVRTNKLNAFRARVRRLDLLAVDDIHFLAAKEKTG